ncbi:MAG: hypothetical protein LAT58_03240 [Opitutales bacterium]|nr:hypothetical protein [Opitutales bacterium]
MSVRQEAAPQPDHPSSERPSPSQKRTHPAGRAKVPLSFRAATGQSFPNGTAWSMSVRQEAAPHPDHSSSERPSPSQKRTTPLHYEQNTEGVHRKTQGNALGLWINKTR